MLHPHDLALDFLVTGFCDPGFTSGCVHSVSNSELASVGSPHHVASPALVLGYSLLHGNLLVVAEVKFVSGT